MEKRLIAISTLVLAFALATATTFAYDGGCMGSEAGQKRFGGQASGQRGRFGNQASRQIGMILKKADEIGLTDEQQTKIKALALEAQKDKILQQAEIQTISLDIVSKMQEDALDTEAINALIDKKYELEKTQAKSSVADYAELKTILTPEQQDKIKELREQFKAKRGQAHQDRGQHGKMQE
ncbi:MAG: Spy/CpxP family protein refolding chaperone [Candidatus Omnitrophica bacterium]|nr:Spy/CpxP family protein refolding chaperone [Candidatus Omnitrophota bacterium]